MKIYRKLAAAAFAAAMIYGVPAALGLPWANAAPAVYADYEAAAQFNYQLLDDGTYAITGQKYTEAEIVIPSEIGGVEVSRIYGGAFSDCKELTSVTLPDTIKKIDLWSFDGCTSLKSITLPDSVTDLGTSAFSGCTALEKVKLSESMPVINYGTFRDCKSLTEITVPKSVTEISANAFDGCDNLMNIYAGAGGSFTSLNGVLYTGDRSELVLCPNARTGLTVASGTRSVGNGAAHNCKKLARVTIPSGVTRIGGTAFANCTMLKTVTLPNTLNELGTTAFSGDKALLNINMPAGGKTFCCNGGAVYSSDLSRLVLCPEGKESIVINPAVTTIGSGAFYNCNKLKTVTLPKNVTVIERDAFTNCTRLTSLVLPEGLKEIGTYAFICCTDLKSIYVPASVKNIGAFALGFEWSAEGSDLSSISEFNISGFSGSEAESYAKEFEIAFTDFSDLAYAKVTIPYASYTYRGRAIKPAVTVKDAAGSKLTNGTDYTVSYTNNTNAGTAAITITGKGKYTGTIQKTFTVKPLDLTTSYAKFSIPYASYTYTGSAIKPAVTVKFKDGDLISKNQYTVSYSGNAKVGTATITIKGSGKNTTGAYKKTFVVKPAKNAIKTITSSTKGAFKLTWTKATAGATGYQVQYSTDKNFKTNVHSYTSTNLSDLSENFSSVPKSGEKWYVKVRSFVTKDGKASSTRYGNYSDVKTIKVK